MSNRRSGLFVGGLLVGAAVGTLAGWLSAPRSGRETRKLLKKSADALPELAEDLSTSLQFQADRLSVSAVRQWDDTLDRLKDALNAGVEAAAVQRQIVQSHAKEDDAA
jgi:gas vesicle protein